MTAPTVRITGGAEPHEVAAVLAALRTVPPREQPSGYERWRLRRLAALRPGR